MIMVNNIMLNEKDILNKRIRLDSDKILYEKCRYYFNNGMEFKYNNQLQYEYYCKGYKCMLLIEKHHPNSEYIFKCKKLIKSINEHEKRLKDFIKNKNKVSANSSFTETKCKIITLQH